MALCSRRRCSILIEIAFPESRNMVSAINQFTAVRQFFKMYIDKDILLRSPKLTCQKSELMQHTVTYRTKSACRFAVKCVKNLFCLLATSI